MLRRLLVAAVVLPLALAGAAWGRATAPLPPSVTTFVITGHGYGHGVGLAQWGAYGYATRGYTYDQILAHYFPGTQLGPAAATKIRVLLASGVPGLTISSTADFQVKDGAGAVHPLAAGAYQVGADLTVQGVGQLAGPLVFAPGRAPLELGKPYRGLLQVSAAGGGLSAVNVVPLDAYARGVVSQEMPKDWPLEAVKTQAVAARSYAMSERRGKSFDVYPDTRDQVYGGVDAETPVGDQAVAGTKGQVLLYNGKVATTYFFSSSGGRTTAISDVYPGTKPVPYLVAVDDPYDTMSPWHNWGPVVLTGAQVSKALKIARVTDLQPSPADGHASTVTIVGSGGPQTVPGTAIRWGLNLRSTWFHIGVLTLTWPGGTVASGSAVTLTGAARRLTGVVLQQKTGTAAWQPGPAIQPASDGSFTVAVTPSATTQYRLAAGSARSLALRVPVAGS